MFKSEQDQTCNIVSEKYESWIIQDQALFTWLLSTISESVFPRVLACKHAYEVWDKVHKHFNSQMKACAHQLRSELKTNKKDSRSISEYVLRIRTIVDSLMAVGDPILNRDQIDAILQGLSKAYNSFIMMVYRKIEPLDIYYV